MLILFYTKGNLKKKDADFSVCNKAEGVKRGESRAWRKPETLRANAPTNLLRDTFYVRKTVYEDV